MNDSRVPLETYEGRGETLAEALEDAAAKAINKDIANVGREYIIVQHIVTVSNPRISERTAAIRPG